MKLGFQEKDGITVLKPVSTFLGGYDAGELDEELNSLLNKGKVKIVLDLSRTDWMNSSGLCLLVHYLKKFRDKGGCIKLACLTGNVKKILIVAKLTTIFELFDDVESASASFA